jgi:hypothetical protein
MTNRVFLAVLLVVAGSWATIVVQGERERARYADVTCQLYVDGQSVGPASVYLPLEETATTADEQKNKKVVKK